MGLITVSREEFQTVYSEVVEMRPPCFDALLHLSDRLLRRTVKRWCQEDLALRDRQYEEDVMQEIQLRLVQYSVTGFFLRNGQPNRSPEEFKSWLFTVALNTKRSFANKVRRIQFEEVEETEEVGTWSHGATVSEEDIQRLNRAFRHIMSLNAQPHIIMTWVAQMVIIECMNVDKIESNDILLSKFSHMSLDSMLEVILACSARIYWLNLPQELADRVRSRLDKPTPDGRRMGDLRYEEVFMKKGGKKSISDWVNKLNNQIAKEEQNGTSDNE